MPAVLPGARTCPPKPSPNGAVPCCPCGADHVCGVSFLPSRGCRAGTPLLLLQLQCQGKHGGVEREESQKLCSCLPTNAGLGRKLFWIYVVTQNNITVSRYFSRLTLVYLSSAIMIHTKLLKILQGAALWSLLYLIFQTVITSQRQISPWTRVTRSQKKHFSKNSRIITES